MRILVIGLAIFAGVACAAYAVSKYIGNSNYRNKWRDYDECGLV